MPWFVSQSTLDQIQQTAALVSKLGVTVTSLATDSKANVLHETTNEHLLKSAIHLWSETAKQIEAQMSALSDAVKANSDATAAASATITRLTTTNATLASQLAAANSQVAQLQADAADAPAAVAQLTTDDAALNAAVASAPAS
jgi:hypothetical protein